MNISPATSHANGFKKRSAARKARNEARAMNDHDPWVIGGKAFIRTLNGHPVYLSEDRGETVQVKVDGGYTEMTKAEWDILPASM